MTPRKPKEQYAKMGRPLTYKPDFAITARKLCNLGLTDVEIALFFEINPMTLYRWKHAFPDFCEALKRSKDLADDVVEASLYKRATGYSHESVKIFMPAGAKAPVYAKFVEHFPPDPSAAKLWLANRRPETWRERQAVDVTGTLSLEALVLEAVKKREPEAGK